MQKRLLAKCLTSLFLSKGVACFGVISSAHQEGHQGSLVWYLENRGLLTLQET